MKRIFYAIIPVLVFGLVLGNALFGQHIFGYGQNINKYAIYVHLVSGWDSQPGNILFEVTNVWSGTDAGNFSDPSDISSLSDYNSNQLEYQNGRSYVELRHEFSGCDADWKPILYRLAVDTVRNRVEIIQGIEQSDDPYISEFPSIQNTNYGTEQHRELARDGYVQFIPICTASNVTAYDYSISLNDRDVGFSAYMVPSKEAVSDHLAGGPLEYYFQEGCWAENHHSYSGSCDEISGDSGLMIILPDKFGQSLTKVRVSMHEKS